MEHAGKVDRNANLPVTLISDELSSSDADKLEKLEAAEQQVVTLFCRSQCLLVESFL